MPRPRASPRRAVAVAAAAAALLALAPRAARAGIGDENWYGYQILGVDALGWSLLIGGGQAESSAVSLTGLATLLLGGPILHVAHGNYGRAGASVGFRVGLPLLGAGIGAGVDGDSRSFLPAGPFIGAFIGSLAASVVDIVWLANDPADPAAARVLAIGGRF